MNADHSLDGVEFFASTGIIVSLPATHCMVLCSTQPAILIRSWVLAGSLPLLFISLSMPEGFRGLAHAG